jgi:hypothetical protein
LGIERGDLAAAILLGPRYHAGPEQHAALERASDMLERLAIALKVFDTPLRSEVGHGRPQ